MSIKDIANMYKAVDSNVESFLEIDHMTYEIERFQILFGQAVDHKGEPQNETKGGQFSLAITQPINDNIYDWAKNETKLKNVRVYFTTMSAGTVLEIKFTDAACISLTSKINAFSGMETMLVVTSDKLSFDEVLLDNRWTK